MKKFTLLVATLAMGAASAFAAAPAWSEGFEVSPRDMWEEGFFDNNTPEKDGTQYSFGFDYPENAAKESYKWMKIEANGDLTEVRFNLPLQNAVKGAFCWFMKYDDREYFEGNVNSGDVAFKQYEGAALDNDALALAGDKTIWIELPASAAGFDAIRMFANINKGGNSFQIKSITLYASETGGNNEEVTNPGDNDNESTGVADVAADEAGAEVVGIYSILGQELKAEPEAGAFIVKFSNGTAKKFVK